MTILSPLNLLMNIETTASRVGWPPKSILYCSEGRATERQTMGTAIHFAFSLRASCANLLLYRAASMLLAYGMTRDMSALIIRGLQIPSRPELTTRKL